MKNRKLVFILSFLLIFVIVPFSTSDPSFSVYMPRKDQVFTIGNNQITWNPPENVNHVKIELHKGYNRVKAIDTWVDNTGSFTWVIDKNDYYEYNNDYRIKVLSSINDDIYGWSNYFCIDLDLNQRIINAITTIIMITLLTIMILMYYNKKTHKIQNKIKEIIKKIKKIRKNDKN